jgi:hypothetical protein
MKTPKRRSGSIYFAKKSNCARDRASVDQLEGSGEKSNLSTLTRTSNK